MGQWELAARILENLADEPDAPNKHPGHSMPSGMGSGHIKPQMVPPRGSGPRQMPPQKRVDPAAEFLRQKSGASGQSLAPFGGSSSTQAQSAARGSKEQGTVPDEVKPKYKGTYVGQSVDTGGRFVRKPVSYKDKETGDTKYSGVTSKQIDRLTWDGTDWVRSSDFKGRRP